MLIVNPFVLQVIISSMPSVLVTGLMPVLSQPLGLSLAGLGLIFLLLRSGNIFGSLLAPRILEKLAPHKLGTSAELINCVSSLLILFSTSATHFAWLFIVCGLIKGMLAGTVNVLRFSWLRRLPDFQTTSHLTLIANALYQSAYAIVGVLLLIGASLTIAKMVLVVDVLTSLFGAYLFWRLKKYGITALNSATKLHWNVFALLVATPARRILLLTDIFICCAMGGTNIMLVKYGMEFFGVHHGYAIALILYGVFYFVGGKLIQIKNHGKAVSFNKNLIMLALIIMILALFLMPVIKIASLQMILFAVVFLCYPIVILQINNEWFKLSAPHEAAQISAAETIYSQCIWGIGELGYSLLLHDNMLRAIFLTIGLLAVVFYPRLSCTNYEQTV